MYSLGRLISMEPNEDIYRINCLFEFYKKLNSITNKYMKCRIRSIYLSDSFSVLFNGSVEQSYEILLDGVKEQVYDVFERHIFPEIKRRDMIITNLESQKEPCLKKVEIDLKKL